MSNTSQKISVLVTALIATLVSAINTHRTDTEAIAKQKAEADDKIQALQDRVKELESEEGDAADVEGLRGQIEDALTQAQAAKPPTAEHVDEVKAIEPAAGDEPKEGADATGDTKTE